MPRSRAKNTNERVKPARRKRARPARMRAWASSEENLFGFDENSLDPKVDETMIVDAGKWLKQQGYEQFLASSKREEKVHWLVERVQTKHKINRKQHLKAVIESYAMFALSFEDADIRDAFVELAKTSRREVNKRTSRLRLIVEQHISYGTEEDNLHSMSRSYSRDVAAIRSLIRRGILPSAVMSLADRPGEGLDAWSRHKETKPLNPLPDQPGELTPYDRQRDDQPREQPKPRVSQKPAAQTVQRVRFELPVALHCVIWEEHLLNGNVKRHELSVSGGTEAHDIMARCFAEMQRLEEPSSQPKRV